VRIAQIISVVDDDEAVCIATSALVRSLGWQANIFASAEAFLQSGQIADTACLISDVRMPNMSGVEMRDRLLQLGYAYHFCHRVSDSGASCDGNLKRCISPSRETR
jgi:FixJ family two-component response regulator